MTNGAIVVNMVECGYSNVEIAKRCGLPIETVVELKRIYGV